MPSRSQASFGPPQSRPICKSVPNGPTRSRSATSRSSTVRGEPWVTHSLMIASGVHSSSVMSGRGLIMASRFAAAMALRIYVQ